MKNRTIDLFGSKWKIKYVDKVISDDHMIYGITIPNKREIHISTKNDDDSPIPNEEISLTLYHELIHAILITGQYIGASDDEPLVEWLARSMKHLNDKNVFKLFA